MTTAGIDLLAAPPGATDLILLAHGGMENSTADPHTWRPPILRMWPLAAAAQTASRAVAPAADGGPAAPRALGPGAAVGLMRYRYRGWNGTAADPAADLRTVLDRLTDRFQRVLLIGHSMGGRAVVAAGNHPLVAGVLGLAPWLPVNEPLVDLRGPVVFAHGTDDRITSLAATTAYARRLRLAGTPVALLAVEGEKHAMLHRPEHWNTLTRRFVTHALTTDDPDGKPALGDLLSTVPDRVDLLPDHPPQGNTLTGIAEIAASRLRLPVLDRL